MYLIIEACDREIAQVVPVNTRGDATEKANGLLKEHCRILDKSEIYDAYASGNPPSDWPPQIHLDSPEDSEAGAWANLNSMHWDAHIVYVPEDAAAAMLDMLLKVLCKAEGMRPDTRCGDGACDDCPITNCLEMLERARGKEDSGDEGGDEDPDDDGSEDEED